MTRPYPDCNKRLKLVYTGITSETGRNLARAMGIGYTQKPRANDIVVIRWGSTNKIVGVRDIALQNADSVKCACHGLHSLMTLEREGVPTVKPFTALPPAGEFPIVGRKKYFHHGGTDLVMLNTIEEAIDNTEVKYYTKYRETTKELRVHVFGNQVIKVFKKVPSEDANPTFRSSLNGWGYARVQLRHYARAREIAVKAVQALGLTYGGVDVGQDADGEWFVFEVNTGPSLNTNTLKDYAERFREHLTNSDVGYETIDYDIETED